jgi:hypothetical protein
MGSTRKSHVRIKIEFTYHTRRIRGLHVFIAAQDQVTSGRTKGANDGTRHPTEADGAFLMIHDSPDGLQSALPDERRHSLLLHDRKANTHRKAPVRGAVTAPPKMAKSNNVADRLSPALAETPVAAHIPDAISKHDHMTVPLELRQHLRRNQGTRTAAVQDEGH